MRRISYLEMCTDGSPPSSRAFMSSRPGSCGPDPARAVFLWKAGRPQAFLGRDRDYPSVGGLFLGSICGLAQDGDLSEPASYALYGAIGTAIASSGVRAAVSRLRDRDMPVWWILLYYGIPAAAITCLGSGAQPPGYVAFGEFVTDIFALRTLFALGCRRGTVGPNRFGPEVSFGRGMPRHSSAVSPIPASRKMR